MNSPAGKQLLERKLDWSLALEAKALDWPLAWEPKVPDREDLGQDQLAQS